MLSAKVHVPMATSRLMTRLSLRGGRLRHEIEAQAGWSNNGLGARQSADRRSGTRVDSADGGSLRFSPLTSFFRRQGPQTR